MRSRLVLGTLVLLACCDAVAGNGLTPSERARQALSASPGRDAVYIDIPMAGNPVANWMLGAAVGKATWMEQLKAAMAQGAETPTNLVVGGEDEDVTRKAIKAAIKSFHGRRLPYLNITVVGTHAKAESLRTQAESLGINYTVLQPGLR